MNIQLWKKRKKLLNLTYDDLAKISGVSKRTIAGIFGGGYKYESPTLNTIQAIERALGINSFETTDTLSEQEQEIISMFRKLPDKLKQLVIDQLIIFSTTRT